MVAIRKPFDTKRVRVCLECVDADGNPEESITQQHLKDTCDIDKIIQQYDRTGLITHVNQSTASYGDYTQVNEYQESLNMVLSAQQAFDELPANVRKRFANDPGEFFEFATNPENHEDMVKLGLANPKEVVEKQQVKQESPKDDAAE